MEEKKDQPDPPTPTPPSSPPPYKKPGTLKTVFTILGLLIFPPIGVFLMWIWMPWKKWIKIVITTFFALSILLTALALYVATTDPLGVADKSQNLPQVPSPTQAIEQKSPSPTGVVEITPSPTPAVNMDDNVQAAIESKNYAALEGHMAPQVNILLHASECCGPITKDAAIKQLDYFKDAATPWTWDQNDATIKKIKSEYPTTFGKGTIGISNDEMVISYEVKDNKIVGLYLSGTYKIMVQ